MDVSIEKPKKSKTIKWIAYLSALGVCVFIVYVFVGSVGKTYVSSKNLRVAEVELGDFVVKVMGSGRIQSENVEWVVPKIPGEIEKVFVKSGDYVKKGQPILSMTNDEVSVELAEKDSRLAEAKAEVASKEFMLEAQRLIYERDYVQVKYDYQAKKALNEAQEKLMQKDNPPISQMLYMETKMQVQQLKELHKLAHGRLINFENLRKSQIDEIRSSLEAATFERDRFAQRVHDLTVLAKSDGVIQDIELKAGQRLTLDSRIGKIVDNKNIFVRLEVPALDGYKLRVGQNAYVDINRTSFKGRVKRIDPNVKGTIVEVDVELENPTDDVRIDMLVNGHIEVKSLANTVFVSKPARAVENGTSKFFKLDEAGERAELTSVSTGAFSSHHVQILAGLSPGDKIILSDVPSVKDRDIFYVK